MAAGVLHRSGRGMRTVSRFRRPRHSSPLAGTLAAQMVQGMAISMSRTFASAGGQVGIVAQILLRKVRSPEKLVRYWYASNDGLSCVDSTLSPTRLSAAVPYLSDRSRCGALRRGVAGRVATFAASVAACLQRRVGKDTRHPRGSHRVTRSTPLACRFMRPMSCGRGQRARTRGRRGVRTTRAQQGIRTVIALRLAASWRGLGEIAKSTLHLRARAAACGHAPWRSASTIAPGRIRISASSVGWCAARGLCRGASWSAAPVHQASRWRLAKSCPAALLLPPRRLATIAMAHTGFISAALTALRFNRSARSPGVADGPCGGRDRRVRPRNDPASLRNLTTQPWQEPSGSAGPVAQGCHDERCYCRFAASFSRGDSGSTPASKTMMASAARLEAVRAHPQGCQPAIVGKVVWVRGLLRQQAPCAPWRSPWSRGSPGKQQRRMCLGGWPASVRRWRHNQGVRDDQTRDQERGSDQVLDALPSSVQEAGPCKAEPPISRG